MHYNTYKKLCFAIEGLLAAHPSIVLSFSRNGETKIYHSFHQFTNSNNYQAITSYLKYCDILFHENLDINNRIKEFIGHPFNIINDILKNIANNKLSDYQVLYFISDLEKCLSTLINIINETIAECVPTDKWLFFFNKRVNALTKEIKQNFNKDFNISNIEITSVILFDYSVIYTFDKLLNYSQKIKVINTVFNYLKPIYENYTGINIEDMNNLFYTCNVFFQFGSRITTDPSNTFSIHFKINSWQSIAINQDAQFLPKIGMNKM